MKYTQKRQDGFTLLEVLLVVGIIVVIAGLSFPLLQGMRHRTDLETSIIEIADSLRRAQILAQSNVSEDDWSVNLENSAITIYLGYDYENRDTSYDETVSLPNDISITGLTDINFMQLSGIPANTGTITITTSGTYEETLSINKYGVISY